MIGLGLAKGLGVTLRNFIRAPVTVQYPTRRVGLLGAAKQQEMNPVEFATRRPADAFKAATGLASVEARVKQGGRFRGQDFNWYEERCTGCATCAKFCPLGIIKIVTRRSGENAQEGETYRLDVFDIDIGRCMYCGICVEVCPYDALHMGSSFERGNYQRQGLVIPVEHLRTKQKTPSTFFRPQYEATEYDPRGGEALPWNRAGRHEQPSRQRLTERWVRRRGVVRE